MGGIFGVASRVDCIEDLFYGTDYLSHLGTRRGGLATLSAKGFHRAIHSLESSYFRTKFEPELASFKGGLGLGAISDTDAQPLIINSHLGAFGIVTVGRIVNLEELARQAFSRHNHFAETSGGNLNPTELVATLICEVARPYSAG